jgi:DNA polymerase-1
MTLLIDADWLVHSACAACECDIRWDEWINTLHLEQADVKDFITSRVAYWQDLAADRQVVMCFSDYPTFRHELRQEYKANRIGKRKPLGLRDIRVWVEQNYEARTCRGLEADDVMGLLSTNGLYQDPVIVSIDKDMRTVPGSLLAGEEVETISPAQANRTWMLQTLSGDSTDNYSGLKGVGPKTAEKLLDGATTLPDMWEKVLAAYKKQGLSFMDAVTNARMARILRYHDYDFGTGEVRLWEPDVDPAMKTDG